MDSESGIGGVSQWNAVQLKSKSIIKARLIVAKLQFIPSNRSFEFRLVAMRCSSYFIWLLKLNDDVLFSVFFFSINFVTQFRSVAFVLNQQDNNLNVNLNEHH